MRAVKPPSARRISRAGTYNLTAVYNGDQNFSAVTSSVIAFQVIPPSVLITSNPATVTTTAWNTGPGKRLR